MGLFLLHLVLIIVGLYLVTLGLWELRKGEDKGTYVALMFLGLILIFALPSFLGFGLGILNNLSRF